MSREDRENVKPEKEGDGDVAASIALSVQLGAEGAREGWRDRGVRELSAGFLEAGAEGKLWKPRRG